MTDKLTDSYDCRRCGSRLSSEQAPQSRVTYYRCPRCGQAVSDADPVALRRAARRVEPDARAQESLNEQVMTEWCRRLEAFQVRAFESDPFARLGLAPTATLEEARERFHALAMQHHPDRGGDAQALAEIIDAYDKVRDRWAKGQSRGTSRLGGGRAALQRRQPESWSRAAALLKRSAD